MSIWKKWFGGKPKSKVKHTEKPEPLVSVVGESIDPEKGLVLTLDWNDEFIQYLRENGYYGTSDETIIQQWLGNLYLDMQKRIQHQQNINSDFE